MRRNFHKLQTTRQLPASNAISIRPSEELRASFEQVPFPTVNKLRQGYAIAIVEVLQKFGNCLTWNIRFVRDPSRLYSLFIDYMTSK
jgi:hypothetical protein